MESSNRLLNGVGFHLGHGLVGRNMSELEEQRDVQPTHHHHAEQEDADGSCVGKRIQPVRPRNTPNRPFDPEGGVFDHPDG